MGERADQLGAYDQYSEADADLSSNDTERRAEEIRMKIEQTRADMTETIDAIQERLNPEHIKEQVKDHVMEQVREATIGRAEQMVHDVRESAMETGYSFMGTIRENPIAAAMAGIGLGWLFMKRKSANRGYRQQYRPQGSYSQNYYYPQNYYPQDTGYQQRSYPAQRGYQYQDQGRYYGQAPHQDQSRIGEAMGAVQERTGEFVDTVQDRAGRIAHRVQNQAGEIADTVQSTASHLQNRAGEFVDTVQDRAGELAYEARDQMQHLGYEVQHQARRFQTRFEQALYENPVAIGAIAVAVGAAVGLIVPETEQENRLMGETRDNLVQQAQEMAQGVMHETIDKVQHVAEQAQEVIQEQLGTDSQSDQSTQQSQTRIVGI